MQSFLQILAAVFFFIFGSVLINLVMPSLNSYADGMVFIKLAIGALLILIAITVFRSFRKTRSQPSASFSIKRVILGVFGVILTICFTSYLFAALIIGNWGF